MKSGAVSPTFSDNFAISGFCASCASGGAIGVAASRTIRAKARFIRTLLFQGQFAEQPANTHYQEERPLNTQKYSRVVPLEASKLELLKR